MSYLLARVFASVLVVSLAVPAIANDPDHGDRPGDTALWRGVALAVASGVMQSAGGSAATYA